MAGQMRRFPPMTAFSPDFSVIKARLKQPVIFDGRNLYEPTSVTALVIEYHGIGREG